MKRNVIQWTLLAAAAVVYPATVVFADGVDCPKAPCPPPACAQAPPSKVIVNIPPPEVVFNQAAACGTCAQRPGPFHRFHHANSSVQVGASFAQPAQMSFMPVSASFVPASFAPVAASPSMGFVSVPAASMASFSAMPVNTSSAFSLAPSSGFTVVPTQSAGFSGVGGCQSSGSSNNSLSDLMALKLKAQELESRATTALAGALRENVQTHQAALSLLNPNGAKNGLSALAPPPDGQARQIEELNARVESLSKSLDATLLIIREIAQKQQGK